MLLRLPCGCCCQVHKDSFDRTSFGAGYTIDNGTTTGGLVHLVSNHIEMSDVSFGKVTYEDIPTHFSIQSDFRLHDHRDVAYIEAVFIFFDGESFQFKKYAVAFTGPEEGETCGKMQLFDLTDIGSPVELGLSRPIPEMSLDTWHTGRLCHNPDTGILTCSVKAPAGGSVHWDHATGITRESVIVRTDAVLMGYSHDSGDTVDFDNLLVTETRSSYYGYYYYYGNSCPCCGGCIDETITFPDDDSYYYYYYGDDEEEPDDADAIDCRLEVSGDVEQEDGVLKVGDGGSVRFNIGTSGVNGRCLPDESDGLGLAFASPDYGTQLTVTIGDVSAVLTWNSGPDTEDGTLQIIGETPSSDDPVTLDAPINQPLKMAALLLDGAFVAGSDGKIVSAEASGDSTISLSVTGGEVDISLARFMTCTSDSDAFNVLLEDFIGFGPSDELADCGPCRPTEGQLPTSLLVLIGGITGGFGVDSFNGAHVVDLQEPPDVSGECEWKAAWQIPPPGVGITQFFTYTITITIFADMTNAYLSALLTYSETGGIPNFGGNAFFQTSIPLDEDGQIDCNALLAELLAFVGQFQFAGAAGATVEVME